MRPEAPSGQNHSMRALAVLMLAWVLLACSKEAAPPSDAALSILEDTSEGCGWKRVEPLLGKAETIATIPKEKCDGVSIAWHGDTKRALLATPNAVWLWTGSALESVPVAPDSGIERAVFDDSGLLAITTTTNGAFRRPESNDFPRLRPLEFGKLTDEELIYRLETTSPWEPPDWVTYGTRQMVVNNSHTGLKQAITIYREAMRADPSRTRDRVAGRSDPSGELEWSALRLPSGLYVARRDVTLVFESKERPAFIPEGDPEAVSVWIRGDHLLVLEKFGSHPRLYDARTGDLVWSAPTATAASFWPKLAPTK